MDSRGNLYEESSGILKDMEKQGVIKNVSEVPDLVPLTDKEAGDAKNMSTEERLKLYEQKLAELQEETLTEPLTRAEREMMNALSLQAYGKRLEWQKMLRKGELRPETIQTSSGDGIAGKRLHYFTVDQIRLTMKKILADREEAARKSEAERLEREKAQQAKEKELENEQSKTGTGTETP